MVELQDNESHDKAHMLVNCNHGTAEIPNRNSLIFVNWAEGQLCTVVKECSNIRSWRAKISVKAEFEYENDLGSIENVIGNSDLEFEGTLTLPEIKLGLAFSHINAYCAELKKSCRSI